MSSSSLPSLVLKLKWPETTPEDGWDPAVWRDVSRRLFHAAQQLWPPLHSAVIKHYVHTTVTPLPGRDFEQVMRDSNLFSGFFTLAAFAVENALKARLVEKRLAGAPLPTGATVFDQDVFPNKDHDLALLAKWADVAVSPGECTLLKRLSAFAKWGGRYPVPKPAKATSESCIEKPGTEDASRRVTRDRDCDDIKAFLNKIQPWRPETGLDDKR